jgi:hypothetical protein
MKIDYTVGPYAPISSRGVTPFPQSSLGPQLRMPHAMGMMPLCVIPPMMPMYSFQSCARPTAAPTQPIPCQQRQATVESPTHPGKGKYRRDPYNYVGLVPVTSPQRSNIPELPSLGDLAESTPGDSHGSGSDSETPLASIAAALHPKAKSYAEILRGR